MSTDLVISFDTTGSISPCIAEIRRKVESVIDRLFDTIPDLRIGIVTHGDACDYPKDFLGIGLTTDRASLKHFVKVAPNTGGGDSDEYYEYVLNRIHGLFDPSVDNKFVILIGDAEPHKVGYRYGNYTCTVSWEQQARWMAEDNIHIYSVQALGRRQATYFYEGLADITNGRKLDLNQFTDAVETVIAICYHGSGELGQLDNFRDELATQFKVNRNLAKLFNTLGARVEVSGVERSGLIPVPPTRFQILHVDHNIDIKSFVEMQGIRFRKGRGFYQLTKSELVQEMKEVILVNKYTGDMFTGPEAREYIGLPFGDRGTVRPVYLEEYDVYVQSTSHNRKLIGGTKFLYENEV